MAAPPQRHGARAARVERAAKMYRLSNAGLTEREIAREVGLSPGRTHEILVKEYAAHVGPPGGEYVDRREGELIALHRVAYAIAVSPATDHETRLKAIDRCLRINESRRKLRGADAPEAMTVMLARRDHQEAVITSEAIIAALDSLSLPPDRRDHALKVAGAVLEGGEVPAPMSSGITAVPYVDDATGTMFIDGPGGLRYRVAGVETQPGEAVDRAELLPARSTTGGGLSAHFGKGEAAPDVIIEELDLIEAEYADLLEEVDDDEPEGDQTPSA
ncbi:hypothetical protein [Streptomyces sp. GESEQ-35]|uniref:hypothetical protein n=1 Tax=Streptomyces sp. GESEQ-35 TaxID=2812657 RepID=UPI001B319588|nr:hypothetical protein [Streptomyces sp. GESEQ-35]